MFPGSTPLPFTGATQIIDIAGEAGITSASTGTSSIGILSLGRVIEIGAGAILSIGGMATFVFLLMGAFNWVTAGGDKGKIETARSMITQAIIGLAILASVFALFGIVTRVLGIQEKIDVGNYGASGSGSGGGVTCSTLTKDVCTKTSGCTWDDKVSPQVCKPVSGGGGASCKVGQHYNDGGSGHYCTNSGAADVVCVSAGVGPSKFNYIHYEPCSCKSGTPSYGWPQSPSYCK